MIDSFIHKFIRAEFGRHFTLLPASHYTRWVSSSTLISPQIHTEETRTSQAQLEVTRVLRVKTCNFGNGFYYRAGAWVPGTKDAFRFLNRSSESQLACNEDVA